VVNHNLLQEASHEYPPQNGWREYVVDQIIQMSAIDYQYKILPLMAVTIGICLGETPETLALSAFCCTRCIICCQQTPVVVQQSV